MGAVSRCKVKFGSDHWIAVKLSLRYLKGTFKYSFYYRPIGLECIGFVDIDFAGDRD